jgi:hypothetical protein
VPRSTAELPDFEERAARLMEGSRQLGEQDTAVNLAMQRTKYSRFAPRGRMSYLEETLSQFNRWLADKYRAQAERMGMGSVSPRTEAFGQGEQRLVATARADHR